MYKRLIILTILILLGFTMARAEECGPGKENNIESLNSIATWILTSTKDKRLMKEYIYRGPADKKEDPNLKYVIPPNNWRP